MKTTLNPKENTVKNHERFAAPYLLATNTDGVISAAGLRVGTGSSLNGSVVCIKTNGGAIVPMQAPGATTIDTVSVANTEQSSGDPEHD